jgi:signal transduction histidine kinase
LADQGENVTRDTKAEAGKNTVRELWGDMQAVQRALVQTSSVDTAALAARIQRWQEALEELTTLQRIDRELNRNLDFERILDQTLSWALRATAAEAGVLSVLDADNRLRMVTASTNGITPTATETEVVKRTMQNTESAVLGEDRILVPIRLEGRAIGVLDLQSNGVPKFKQEHAHLANRLADRAAIAIENARLYDGARRANQAKSEFVSFVTHELRTPLTSIRGYASLLGNELVGSLSPKQKEFAQAIHRNVDRMKVLVSDLQDISRIEAGQLRLDRKPVSLTAALTEASQATDYELEDGSHKVRLDIPDDLPEALADPTYLTKILVNLLRNACKYAPEGEHIRVQARCTEGRVQCTVCDDGLVAPPEDQAESMDKFSRSESAAARQMPGKELGLSVAEDLVEIQGGEMRIESQPGQGPVVTFTLPIADVV